MCVAPLSAPHQGATFACINAAAVEEAAAPAKEGKEEGEGEKAAEEGTAAGPKLATFAFRLKSSDALEQFVAAVNAHKATGASGGEGGGAQEEDGK